MSHTQLLAETGRSSSQDPTRIAVSVGTKSITYSELDREITRVHALYVRLGLQRGQRIVLLLPSGLEFVLAYFAAHRAGLVVVPLNPLLGAQEVGSILQAMRPVLVVSWATPDGPPAVQRLPALIATCSPQSRLALCGATDAQTSESSSGPISFDASGIETPLDLPWTPRAANDEVLILYTSGTSGKSKGVSLIQSQILNNASHANRVLGFTQEDVILSPLPVSHVFGQLVVMLGTLLAGAHLVLISRADPAVVFESMLEFQPTVVAAVPTTFIALSKFGETDPALSRRTARRLRLAFSGGAKLLRAAEAHFAEVFGPRVHQGYGMTEVACCIALDDPRKAPSGGVGRMLAPPLEYRIDPLDSSQPGRGQLLLRGPNVYRGYYIDDSFLERAPQEWFATGDIVQELPTGAIEIVDRLKDMIIRGGYNVYPAEVEQVLASHPRVLHAAVIGVSHPGLGQEVAAFVTLRDTAPITGRELAQWCKDRIALYKYPRLIAVLATMPTNPTGKIMKQHLDTTLLIGIDE
jgi:long-chain acyl-CoA synthetase